jgi:hypothetical protein
MIYKFKSKATGDLIMLGAHGDELMRLMGREPAAQGIVQPADMPAALQALQAAIAAREVAADAAAADGDEQDVRGPHGVSLRQRAWPLIEMLRRAQAAGEPVVWGV